MADKWIADVENGFRNQNLNSVRRSEKVSIYKVPEFLVQVKRSAYVPQMVSLGPLHHVAHPEMLPHKLHATQKMFEYMTKEELEKQVIGPILTLFPTVRKCYQYHIEYEDRRLAWMLTLDACFILEILRALGTDKKSDHCLFDRNTIEYTAYPIIIDILMLENQIPLCVLLKILELKGKNKKDKASPFTELCELVAGARIARLFYPFKETDPPLHKIPGAQKSKHLLDLIRMYVIHPFQLHQDEETEQPCPDLDQPYPDPPEREIIIPSASEIPMYVIHLFPLHQETYQPWPVPYQPCPDPPKREIIIPSASELRRAGIKFTKMEGNFMEISIKKNRFHLPRIRISSSVETLLRNLMALEICEAEDMCVISRYVLLMCELIHSEKDVSVLRKARIIKSYMGNDRELADLFHRLSEGITRSYEDPFAKVREDAHNHYHSKIKVMIAEFTDDHCSSPWRTVSVIAACMLLLFAVVQTIFSLHRRLLTN